MNRKLYQISLYGVLVVSLLFLLASLILYFVVLLNPAYFSFSGQINVGLASQFGDFFGGLIGTTAGIVGSLLVVVVFLVQNRQAQIRQLESIFFKLVDCHRDNVRSLSISDYRKRYRDRVSGRRAFVVFKLQIFDCLDVVEDINKGYSETLSKPEIMDVAYMIFYYGIPSRPRQSDQWDTFTKDLYTRYEGKIPGIYDAIVSKVRAKNKSKSMNVGRTNQTSLSAYFRNFSNAIRIIHESNLLSRTQKYNYVKLLRSQLSNSEQLVLYFNVMSRFGKDWNDNNWLTEYSLIKNLPSNYVSEEYDFRKYYKLRYEDEDYS